VESIRSGRTEIPDSRIPDSKTPESTTPDSKTPESTIPEFTIPDSKDSDASPLTTLVFSKLLTINFGLAPLVRVKALNAAANRAARRYLKFSMAGLTSFLIGSGKKTGLLFGVSGG